MAFDWLEAKVPASVRARGPDARKRMHEDEVRQRAGLMRRLGRGQEEALSRCLAHLAWGYEKVGTAPLSEDEVRAIVAKVYR